MPASPSLGPVDSALRERARRVVPGGLWGHLTTASLPEGYPQFFARGQGARIWDVDGREYLDFMCSWGPIVLGHCHPEVEAAARRQAELGDCLNGPGEVLVRLAERLVGMVAHADWVQLAKNGNDATTGCVTIARAATGKRKILKAARAYHGSTPWCSPSPAGVLAEDRAHLLHFEYNDIASLEAMADRADGDLAGIMVSAFRHDLARDQELPTPAFARRVRELCDQTGAVLILDDVRAGFRLDLGGSWETVGIRPDLSAFSKAIANGHALAAIAGSDRLREAAASVFMTGSFWCTAVPMAAALATLEVMERDDVIGRMVAMGTALREGLDGLSRRHGIPLRQTGPVQMPMVLFEDDADLAKGFAFCAEALRQGVYLHPRHTMFLSAAHGPAEIDRVLTAMDAAFGAIRP